LWLSMHEKGSKGMACSSIQPLRATSRLYQRCRLAGDTIARLFRSMHNNTMARFDVFQMIKLRAQAGRRSRSIRLSSKSRNHFGADQGAFGRDSSVGESCSRAIGLSTRAARSSMTKRVRPRGARGDTCGLERLFQLVLR
jgi:hypothetical protein